MRAHQGNCLNQYVGIPMCDKIDEFNQERLLRGDSKIPISKTSDALLATHFFRLWRQFGVSPCTRYFLALFNGNFIGDKKKKELATDKVVNSALMIWVSIWNAGYYFNR